MTYLETLTIRLANAIAQLPADTRDRHGSFVLSKQREDGGFAGREGASDLYYTSFALRSLAILGLLEGDVADRAAQFLESKLQSQESIVDFLSLVYGAKLIESAAGLNVFESARSDWTQSVASALNELRRPDGGFAKGPAGKASSTYHTFLVLLCLELIAQPIEEPESIIGFVQSQEAEDGGFREIRVSKRAGTNPTAAAIGVLRILDAVSPDVREGTLDFLCEMQNDEGGLRANTRIPIADILSSFTGLLTLADLGAAAEIDVVRLGKYATSLEQESGGFFGAAWDSVCDVEYTFYGLATTALVASLENQ